MATSGGGHPLDRWEEIGGVAGLVFVALTLVGGFVQGDVPVYTEGPGAVKDWFAGNSDRYLVGALLIVLGILFFLGFLAALVAALLRADTHGPWPWLVLLAGAHLVVAAQASSAFDPTLALLEGDVSDDVARMLSAADYMTFLLLYPFSGVLTLAVSLSILRTAVLWRPLAWFGPLVTVGGLVAATAPLQHDAEGVLTTVGYVTLLAFLAWTAATSLSMVRAGGRQ
jgi:hypothetical protein